MLAACSACLLPAAAYWAACRLTGENLLAAWFDEARLRRADVRSLDARCAGNPRNSGLIVSLTTIPSRAGAVELTLKSLLRQSMRPVAIRLCVPEWCEREERSCTVPKALLGLRCVSVVRAPDAGPATKFLSSLAAAPPNQAVMVVDDDRAYHPRLLETYAALAGAHPDQALAGAGWNAPSDLIDRPTTLWRRLRGAPHVPIRANQVRRPFPVDIMQGMHSYLVRPRFFELGELQDFSRAPAAVRFVDDVWISAHCRAGKWVHPMPLGFTDYSPWAHRKLMRRTSLGGTVNRAARDEERANSIGLGLFRDRWRE